MAGRVYKLRERRVDWRIVEGEVIALDLERAEYFAINPSGAELWPLLVAGASQDDLVRRLQDTFGLDSDQATADLDAFIETLATRQLIEAQD